MIDLELLETTLKQTFPITSEMSPEQIELQQKLRDAFKSGMEWGFDHPAFDRGCSRRIWHYLTEDRTDLPELNRVCLIKFRDGTGGVASLIEAPDAENISAPGDTDIITPSNPDSGTVGQKNARVITSTRWSIRYRDDIIAWSYYVMDKVDGSYV